MQSDPYAVLGIAPGASASDIREAYEAVLNKLKGGGFLPEDALARIDAARAAFKTLSNPPTPETSHAEQEAYRSDAKSAEADDQQTVASIRFTGSAGEYFRVWIVNICLSVITLGIYSAWAKVRRKQYFYGNTVLDDSAFEYLANPKSILKGRLIVGGVVLLISLANQFLKIKIFGLIYLLALPFLLIKAARFNAVNSAYRNVRFNFGANFPEPKGRFKRYTPGYRETSQFLILPTVLVPITLGLLYPYYAFRKRQFMLQHSGYGTAEFDFDAKAGSFYRAYIKIVLVFLACMLGGIVTIGIGLIPLYILFASYRDAAVGRLTWQHTTIGSLRFDCHWKTWSLFKLNFLNSVAIIFSLGLLVPWAEIRTARYQLQGLELVPASELNSFVSLEQQQVSAVGDEAGDFLGFDFGL